MSPTSYQAAPPRSHIITHASSQVKFFPHKHLTPLIHESILHLCNWLFLEFGSIWVQNSAQLTHKAPFILADRVRVRVQCEPCIAVSETARADCERHSAPVHLGRHSMTKSVQTVAFRHGNSQSLEE